jgi:hypothetical protein
MSKGIQMRECLRLMLNDSNPGFVLGQNLQHAFINVIRWMSDAFGSG